MAADLDPRREQFSLDDIVSKLRERAEAGQFNPEQIGILDSIFAERGLGRLLPETSIDATRDRITGLMSDVFGEERVQEELPEQVLPTAEPSPTITDEPPLGIPDVPLETAAVESTVALKEPVRTQISPETIPVFLRKAYNESIVGLAETIATGEPPFDLSGTETSQLEDIASTIAGFLMPVDLFTFVAGGGIGGLAFKGALKITVLKTIAKRTAEKLVKSGLSKKLAEKTAIKGVNNIVQRLGGKEVLKAGAEEIAKKAVVSGTGLGIFEAVRGGLGEKVETGEVTVKNVLDQFERGFTLGSTAAIAGAGGKALGSVGGKIAASIGELGGEVISFGTLGAAIDGRTPTKDDYLNAAGVIVGMRSARLVGKNISSAVKKVSDVIESTVKAGAEFSEAVEKAKRSEFEFKDFETKEATPEEVEKVLKAEEKEVEVEKVEKEAEATEEGAEALKLASKEEATAKGEELGLEFAGIQKDAKGQDKLLLFNDPKTKSTLAVENLGELESKLAESRKTFGVEEKPAEEVKPKETPKVDLRNGLQVNVPNERLLNLRERLRRIFPDAELVNAGSEFTGEEVGVGNTLVGKPGEHFFRRVISEKEGVKREFIQIGIPLKNPPKGVFTHEIRHALDDKFQIRQKLNLSENELSQLKAFIELRPDIGLRSGGKLDIPETVEAIIDAVLKGDTEFISQFPKINEIVSATGIKKFSDLNIPFGVGKILPRTSPEIPTSEEFPNIEIEFPEFKGRIIEPVKEKPKEVEDGKTRTQGKEETEEIVKPEVVETLEAEKEVIKPEKRKGFTKETLLKNRLKLEAKLPDITDKAETRSIKTQIESINKGISSIEKEETRRAGEFTSKAKISEVEKKIKKDSAIRPDKSNVAATAIDNFLDINDAQIDALKEPTVKKVKRKLATGLIDVSATVKSALLKRGGKEGKRALIYKDLQRGSAAKAAQILNDADKVTFKGLNQKEHKTLDRLIFAKSRADILDLKKESPDFKVTGGFTKDEWIEYEKGIRSSDAPEGTINKLLSRRDEYFKVMQDNLKELKKEKLISDETFDLLKDRLYERTAYIEFVDPVVDRITDKEGNKFTVHSSGLKRRTETGSTGFADTDSKRLMGEVIAASTARIAKNRANLALWDLANKDPFNGIVRTFNPKGEKLPGDWEELGVMVDGTQKHLMMPKIFSREWLTMDPLISEQAANMIGWVSGAKILRAMATGLNPEFALTNFPRDVAHVYLSTQEFSKHLPVFIGQMSKELAITAKDALLRQGRWRDYINQGGGMEFLTHQGGGGSMFGGNVGKLAPIQKYMGFMGEFSEMWTRLALRERALRQGKDPIEATWIARNYLDFSQGGNLIKAIDSGVPYLNAGIQGTRGIIRSGKVDPAGFAVKSAWIMGTASSVWMMNRFVNEDAWKSISNGEKVRNWIFTTPLWEKDENGVKRYFYFKVAKDQGQRVMASASEALMAKYFDGDIPEDQLVQSLIDFVPMMPKEIVPPALEAFYGYTSNFDFWRDQKIWRGGFGSGVGEIDVTKEFRPSTHPFFVDAGETLNMSPERLKFALSQFFTTGNLWTSAAGGTYNLLTEGLSEDTIEEMNLFFLQKQPFIRRTFSKTRGGKFTEEIKRIKEAEVAENTRRVVQNRELNKRFNDVEKGESTFANIGEWIKTQPPLDRKRLAQRTGRLKKIGELEDRSLWLNLAELPVETRVSQFFLIWEKSDDDTKKQLMRDLRIAPGVWSKHFEAAFTQKVRNYKDFIKRQ